MQFFWRHMIALIVNMEVCHSLFLKCRVRAVGSQNGVKKRQGPLVASLIVVAWILCACGHFFKQCPLISLKSTSKRQTCSCNGKLPARCNWHLSHAEQKVHRKYSQISPLYRTHSTSRYQASYLTKATESVLLRWSSNHRLMPASFYFLFCTIIYLPLASPSVVSFFN